jgi:hypothetical protein
MKKYTLWEVVNYRNGNRVALVKTKNVYNSEMLNAQYGHKIVSNNFNPKYYDWGIFDNGGYFADEKRCKEVTIKIKGAN